MKVRLPVLLFMSLSDENNQEEECLEEYWHLYSSEPVFFFLFLNEVGEKYSDFNISVSISISYVDICPLRIGYLQRIVHSPVNLRRICRFKDCERIWLIIDNLPFRVILNVVKTSCWAKRKIWWALVDATKSFALLRMAEGGVIIKSISFCT